MGIDYYNCDDCGEIFADCCTHASCDSCGMMLCSRCMSKHDISRGNLCSPKHLELGDDVFEACPFCEIKVISNDDLFEYALKKLKTTKDELKEQLIKAQKKVIDN